MAFLRAARIRQIVDLAVTLAMGLAAGLIIWRTLAAPVIPPAQARPPVVEDVTSAGLVTDIANRPVKGDPAARVVMIEFADFECPFCKKHVEDTLDRIHQELVATGKVQYGFRHLPLEMHRSAIPAAQAAECAAGQGKFWEMHRYLFGHQSELAQGPWLRSADELGLSDAAFQACLRGTTSARIREDLAEAARVGAKATPTFLIGRRNEDREVRVIRKIQGAQPFEVYEAAVNEVLQAE